MLSLIKCQTVNIHQFPKNNSQTKLTKSYESQPFKNINKMPMAWCHSHLRNINFPDLFGNCTATTSYLFLCF